RNACPDLLSGGRAHGPDPAAVLPRLRFVPAHLLQSADLHPATAAADVPDGADSCTGALPRLSSRNAGRLYPAPDRVGRLPLALHPARRSAAVTVRWVGELPGTRGS